MGAVRVASGIVSSATEGVLSAGTSGFTAGACGADGFVTGVAGGV